MEAGTPGVTRPIDVIIADDHAVVRDGIRPRLAESIDLALKLGEGSVILSAQTESGWDDRLLSVNFACPRPSRAAVPNTRVPSWNSTVPTGKAGPNRGCTIAVIVTDRPTEIDDAEAIIPALVGARLTVTDTGGASEPNAVASRFSVSALW